MKKRIDACAEIYERIKAERTTIGIKTFKDTPDVPAKAEECPVLTMTVGVDDIIKRSSRTATASRKGESDIRSADIHFEMVVNKTTDDPLQLMLGVRKAILADIHPLKNVDDSIDYTTFIVESHSVGPLGYGVPNLLVAILVIKLVYTDGF